MQTHHSLSRELSRRAKYSYPISIEMDQTKTLDLIWRFHYWSPPKQPRHR